MEKMLEHIEKRFPVRLIKVRENTIDFALTSDEHHPDLYDHIFAFMQNYFPQDAFEFMTVWNLQEGKMVYNH